MAETAAQAKGSRLAVVLAGVVGVTLVVALTGYLVFRFFATTVMPDAAVFGLLPLAAIGAVASFFSPCSFPLLPGYLSFYYRNRADAPGVRWWRLGGAAAAGVLAFTLLLGGLIALLGAAIGKDLSISSGEPSDFTRIFRAIVGTLLIGLGILAYTTASTKMHAFTRYARATGIDKADSRAYRNVFLYGFGYNAAGIGCAGPILAGVIVLGLTTGGPVWALAGFVVYGFVMAALMFLVSSAARDPDGAVVSAMRRNTGRVKVFAGTFQILVGIFLVATAIWVGWFIEVLFP